MKVTKVMTQAKAIRTSRAFTLIEVLMAISLLSVMVLLLFGTLKISAESWEKGEKKVSEVNEMAVVYNFFQRHLVASKPLWDDFTNPGVRTLGFQGNIQSLQFVSGFPASADRTGAQLFTVKYREGVGESPSLEVTITPFHQVSEGVRRTKDEITLIKGVSHFKLAYFGETPEAGQAAWQDYWLDQENPPKMVRVDIGLIRGGFWPIMVFPVKVHSAASLIGLGGIGSSEQEEGEGEDEAGDEQDEMADDGFGAGEE